MRRLVVNQDQEWPEDAPLTDAQKQVIEGMSQLAAVAENAGLSFVGALFLPGDRDTGLLGGWGETRGFESKGDLDHAHSEFSVLVQEAGADIDRKAKLAADERARLVAEERARVEAEERALAEELADVAAEVRPDPLVTDEDA